MPTQVPSSGMIENVYLNSKYITANPTDEALKELYDILSSIQYIPFNNFNIYAVVSNSDMSYGLSIRKNNKTIDGEDGEVYVISYTNNNNVIDYLILTKNLNTGVIDYIYDEAEIGNLSNVISFNFENQVSILAEQAGQTMQNDKLTQLFSITPFEEPIPLKPFLKGLADAIREKKKTTELINAQNFRSEILSIQGGANVVKSGGTVVPNRGTISEIYFNTNLSVEEVKSILDTLTFIDIGGGMGMYVGLQGSNNANNFLSIMKNNGNYFIMFEAYEGSFVFSSAIDETVGTTFAGWIDGFNGVIEVNDTLSTEMDGMTIGAENDKLTNLISITEGFESGVIKTLEGDYEAVDLTFNELPSGPTPLENNLNVEKIYFNTKLTTEEVDAILDTLTLDSDLSYAIRYQHVEGTTTWHTPLVITKAEAYVSGASGYAITISTLELIYASNETVSNFVSSYLGISAKVGWNVSELEATSGTILDVGADGDKLTQLFSATPFVESNTIDLEQYLDNKQMPMSVKVNVGGGEDMLQARVDATNSCAYLFYRYIGNNVDFIKDLDTSNVTSMIGMFYNSMVTTIPQLDTSNVTNMSSMFSNSILTTIPQLDMIKVSNVSQMFHNCSKLTNLTLLNIKVNLDLSQSEKLTLESLINTVKEFINVGSARILTMGTANLEKIASTYVKFTDSSVTTIPTNEKGDVVVCESTDEGAMLLKDYALLKNWTLA